jgi:predicted AAA+ superfamily ATPase
VNKGHFLRLQRTLNLPLGPEHSLLLFGPRGTGKTSKIREVGASHPSLLQINLLESRTFRRLLADPGLLCQEVSEQLLRLKDSDFLLVTIDEVQKIPELMDEVHNLIETHPNRLQFILTGSSARKLKAKGANLLAGRAMVLNLHPLTAAEIPNLNLSRVLKFGSLPKALLSQREPTSYLEAYVGTYLKEEIQAEGLVRRLESFHRFIEVAAQVNGTFVNYSKIARDCNVAASTVQNYFQILEDTLLVFRLDPWLRSVREQIKQQPKYYFFDLGVLNAIRGELRIDLKPSSYRYGSLFESWIIQELHRWNGNLDFGLKLYQWHDEGGHEVDCIAEQASSMPPFAIEIKSGTAPQANDLEGLIVFGQRYPNAKLRCFCNTPHPYRVDKSILCVPWQDGLKELFDRSKWPE